jgi:4a-hydroxytetrahydrobiopterin dehydratase
MTERITASEFHAAEDLDDWRAFFDGPKAFFRTGSYAASTELAAAIGRLGVDAGFEPDVELRAAGVTVRLLATPATGFPRAHIDQARRISAVAAGLGATADLTMVRTIQVSIDALASAEVMPFWRAVLGYEPAGEEDLVDPHTGGPALWFQDMDAPRLQRNRIHLDLCLAPELVEARVAAGVAAGGRIVFDKGAPMWWTLADPEGNEVDITSMAHRD